MKFSVTSYSYNQYIRDGRMTQLDAVRVASEMGFDGIEFTDLCPNSKPTWEEQIAYAKEIRAEAEKYGIEVVAYAIGAKLYHPDPTVCAAEVERLKRQVDVAAALGVKVMRHDVCSTVVYDGVTVSFDKMLPVIADGARQVAEYAATRGVRTCSENHGFVAQDSDRVERLYNAVNHPNYGVLVDVGNFACADEDHVLAVSRLAPYAVHVHAKDFYKFPYGAPGKDPSKFIVTRGCNLLKGCVIGEGDVPVAQCVAILKRAGYDGYITVEYEGVEDCMAGVARGLANLKTMVG